MEGEVHLTIGGISILQGLEEGDRRTALLAFADKEEAVGQGHTFGIEERHIIHT